MLTALTIVVNLVAFVLAPKQAFITLAVYILLGAVGVPVFVGGMSGPGKLFWTNGRIYFRLSFGSSFNEFSQGKNE